MERQPSGLWLCHPCLKTMEVGDYLHIRKIATDYIKCKTGCKRFAEYQFLTRYTRSPNFTLQENG